MTDRGLIAAGWIAAALTAAALQAAPPPLPPTPAPVAELLYARDFALENGFPFAWSSTRPTVTEGTILVLKVDPELVYPRETLEPVLYVGNFTAEQLNRAYPSGVLLALVPAVVDLRHAPIWFGSPELPERVTPERCRTERSMAELAGIEPFGLATVASSRELGGPPLLVEDATALNRELHELFLRYVPRSTDPSRGPRPAPQ